MEPTASALEAFMLMHSHELSAIAVVRHAGAGKGPIGARFLGVLSASDLRVKGPVACASPVPPAMLATKTRPRWLLRAVMLTFILSIPTVRAGTRG